MQKRRHGFTIVELLIVIVVIGILAALSVTAYNGIQSRATVSQTAHFASTAVKTLKAYKAAEGTYPGVTGCIGSGYVDRTSDGTADCRWNSGGSVWSVNSTLNAQLEKYVQVGKVPTYFVLDAGTIGLQGAAYYYNTSATLNGAAHADWIVYAVQDNVCPVGPISERVSWPNMVTNPSVTRSYPLSGGGSECWIALT